MITAGTKASQNAASNAMALEAELGWLESLIQTRLSMHFGQAGEEGDIREILPLDLTGISSAYAQTVTDLSLGFAKHFKPGYRSLFFGPPGTGKTLTATLIGQAIKTDVYRIDLAMLLSRYSSTRDRFSEQHRSGLCAAVSVAHSFSDVRC